MCLILYKIALASLKRNKNGESKSGCGETTVQDREMVQQKGPIWDGGHWSRNNWRSEMFKEDSKQDG